MNDNVFNPANVTVAVGDTVTWSWKGGNSHSVTFDSGGPNSTVQTTGSTFERVFSAAGTFTYYCTVHGKSVMSGTVTVG